MRIMVLGDRNEFFGVFLTEARRWGCQMHGGFRTEGLGGLFLLELLNLFFAQAGGLDDEFYIGSGGF